MNLKELANKNGGLLVFNDSIGRTCYGRYVGETEDRVQIEQPALIMVIPGENGQGRIDILRLFLNELIEPNSEGEQTCVMAFERRNITTIDVKISDALRTHYNTNVLGQAKQTEPEPEQIKLFDN